MARTSTQAVAGRDAGVPFPERRRCPGMSAVDGCLLCRSQPAVSWLHLPGLYLWGVVEGAFWQNITSGNHAPSIWRRQIKGKGLAGEGQG